MSWTEFINITKYHLKNSNINEAKQEIQKGLDQYPNRFELLIVASDVYRASGELDKSLHFAKLLIACYPQKIHGYICSVQNLIILKYFKEAEKIILAGLENHPYHKKLLTLGNDVYRNLGNRAKSMEYSELLIAYHGDDQIGYIRLVEDLISLERFEEVQEKLDALINKIPHNTSIESTSQVLKNDIENIRMFKNNLRQYNLFDNIAASNDECNQILNGNSDSCFLLRCISYTDESVQELAEELALYVPKKDIWFVHDSDFHNPSLNVISVVKFRKELGIDWSIISKKGWLFGDFCYYSALWSGLTYKYFHLIEDDVRFCGDSFNIYMANTKNEQTDFLCLKLKKKPPSNMWVKKYAFSHPSENSCHGCFFPVSRISRRAACYLLQRRIEEFRYFLEHYDFTHSFASKYFSNDEAFTSNSIANSSAYSISRFTSPIFNQYMGLGVCLDAQNIPGDHVIHRYCPEDKTFKFKFLKRSKPLLATENPDRFIAWIDMNCRLNQYSIKAINLMDDALRDLRQYANENQSDILDRAQNSILLSRNFINQKISNSEQG